MNPIDFRPTSSPIEGLCSDGLAHPDMWFTESQADINEAKRICNQCPFKDACLSDALSRGETWGVWGGLSAGERDRLTKSPRRRVGQTVICAGCNLEGIHLAKGMCSACYKASRQARSVA